MSVLSCDRLNCDNIMCDYTLFHYYICEECLEELRMKVLKIQNDLTVTEMKSFVEDFIESHKPNVRDNGTYNLELLDSLVEDR